MANMDVTQRTQFERVDLTVPTTGVTVRSVKPLVIYTIVASVLLIVLGYAAIGALEGWSRFAVLGGIILTAIGGAIAIDPERRG